MAKISVILPSLNVGDYIDECVESVRTQTLQDIEIICVDAGSTDGTCEKLEKYAGQDDRIQLLHSDKKSYGYQVNLGIEVSHGKYIAILETDDYVDQHMYENLYLAAEENGLDFVLADFDQIWDDESGQRQSKHVLTWAECLEIYHKILDTDDLKSKYNANPNLWRGIYAKQFLAENGIRLNETKGAAYQDICFMHRVIMHAASVMYLPESYYRYRVDRDGSSVNSVNGLKYAYWEYRYLLEHDGIVPGFEPRVYYMMANSFLGEIRQIRPRMSEKWKEENEEYYLWLRGQMQEGIEKGYLSRESLGGYLWNMLQILVESMDGYIQKLDYPGNLYQIIQKTKGKNVIIFGAGIRGKFVQEKIKNDVSVAAFCDNNPKLMNISINRLPILPLGKCTETYLDGIYVISNKNGKEEVETQLLKHGIAKNSILKYIADNDIF